MDIAIWPRLQRGASALDLITTLTVSVVTLALGFPMVQSLSANSHMSTAINSMVIHLHKARSEAITRSDRTILCPTNNGESCVDGYIWQEGYILFMDTNHNDERDPGEEILNIYRNTPGPIKVFTSTGRRFIRFLPEGMSLGTNTTFTFCDPNDRVEPKAVILSNTGRTRLSSTRPDGSPLTCI